MQRQEIGVSMKTIMLYIFWLIGSKMSIQELKNISKSVCSAKSIQDKLNAKDVEAFLNKLQQSTTDSIYANIDKLVAQYTWKLSSFTCESFKKILYFIGVLIHVIADNTIANSNSIKAWIEEAEKSNGMIRIHG